MAGRPPKEKSFANMLRIAVMAEGSNGPKLRDIAEKLVVCAMAGEPWAIQQVADRLDGKPEQAMELNHDVSDAFAKLWSLVSAGTATALADGVAQEPGQSAPIRH